MQNTVRCSGNDRKKASERGSLGYYIIKRLFDIIFSLLVLVVLFIPSLILSLAIALESPGSPIFRQKRIGKNGREIRIFKFRSMVSDAHKSPEKYLGNTQMIQWTREQKVDDDPRITNIGRFIRRTSIDEVPQFINVLIGDMSVIGPRPVTYAETYEYGEYRDEILSVLPGITGWWQATDRNDATWDNGRRQELELYYVRNASLGLDAKIIIMTISAMFGHDKTGR